MLDTPQAVFDALPDSFQPQKAGAAQLALQFELSGEQGGEWGISIADGVCQTSVGRVKNPVATIKMSDRDFVSIFTGKQNAVAAYMTGRIKVSGDVTAIMNLLSFFKLPG